jgi:hypothetical protein
MPMLRRLTAAAAVALCTLVPASAAQASGADVIKDCVQNGRLTKVYTQKEYRDALAHIPSDVDEYTNCRSVIRRAELGLGSGGGGQGTSQNPFAGATPEEVARAQGDIAAARKSGVAQQRIGGGLVTPGALSYRQVRAVSKLPTPLLVLVILIVLGAAGLSYNLFRSRREHPGDPGA